MSKLTDFYAHKAALREKDLPVDAQWELQEDQLLKEEVLPELIEQLKTVLSKVKSPLMFSGYYAPNGCLRVSLTRNCMPMSMQASQPVVQKEQSPIVAEDISSDDAITYSDSEESDMSLGDR